MDKYRVMVWFQGVEITVTAKNTNQARRKAYKRLSKKSAMKVVDKKATDIMKL